MDVKIGGASQGSRLGHAYASVKRLGRQIKWEHPEVVDVMEHPPGQEAQVDYFQGPPTFHGEGGKWHSFPGSSV